MSEHQFQDDLEERDDVVDSVEGEGDDEQGDGEPWAKTSSGNADDVTADR